MTVALVYRKPGSVLPPGGWDDGCAATPAGAWAWLHTLRTGEPLTSKLDVMTRALAEKDAWLAAQPRPKPVLVPLPVKRFKDVKLRVQRTTKPATEPEYPGPMIA